jgi:hypothetical protein
MNDMKKVILYTNQHRIDYTLEGDGQAFLELSERRMTAAMQCFGDQAWAITAQSGHLGLRVL